MFYFKTGLLFSFATSGFIFVVSVFVFRASFWGDRLLFVVLTPTMLWVNITIYTDGSKTVVKIMMTVRVVIIC